jgi:hypothetical protein
MKRELAGEKVMLTQKQAREELQQKSQMREALNLTSLVEER